MSWLIEQSRRRIKSGDVIGTAKIIAWSIRERYYEQLYGISSSAPVSVDELGTDANTCEDYDPTSYLILRKIFRRLWKGREHGAGNRSFLDVGCGKGRVTCVAATYPYRQVIGIELSSELALIARRNVAQRRDRSGGCDVQIVQADAATFEIPDVIDTVFLYNPFRGPPMDSFMRNLHASFHRARRDITLVFVNPIRFEAGCYPWLRTIDQFHCFYPHYDHEMKVVMYSMTAAGPMGERAARQ